MKLKIMIITSEYLKEYFSSNLKELNDKYDIEIKVYKSFKNILEIYNEFADSTDGFLISGKFARSAILKGKRVIKKPTVTINLNLEDIYKTIIDLLLENRKIDLNRVFFDFLIPVGNNFSVESFLNESTKNFSENKLDVFIENLDFEKITIMEENLKREILQFWKLNTLDLIICQFSNIIPSLIENEIPFIYPFPSKENLKNTFDNLVNLIKIDKSKENYPAIIQIELNKNYSADKITKNLKKFLLSELIEYNLDIRKDYLRIFLTSKELKNLTDNFKISKISKFLKETFEEDFTVSYSIGKNFANALKNSEIAYKESIFRKESFIVNEKENLIGPLDSENYIIVNKNVDENIFKIAQKTNLSTNSIQKINAILTSKNTNTITSIELAKYLGSTTRNANRILQNLVNSKLAIIKQEKSTNTKGRPIKLYEINFK